MFRFCFPAGAWFFLALIPLVILYLPETQTPATDDFVTRALAGRGQRPAREFAVPEVSLAICCCLLQLILLCLIILALMQPFLSGDSDSGGYVPVLIDCSASMASTDGDGQTRLDRAKEQARDIVWRRPADRIVFVCGHGPATDRVHS